MGVSENRGTLAGCDFKGILFYKGYKKVPLSLGYTHMRTATVLPTTTRHGQVLAARRDHETQPFRLGLRKGRGFLGLGFRV